MFDEREAFTGVLLAFAVPYSAKQDEAASPSHRLENVLHMPIAFLILPVFTLANTGIVIGAGWAEEVLSANSLGILLGLVIGKPVGILLSSFVAVTLGICCLPFDLAWRHVVGAGLLGGIGFTLSILSPTWLTPNKPALLLPRKWPSCWRLVRPAWWASPG